MKDEEVYEEDDHSQRVSETSSHPTINRESEFRKLIINVNETLSQEKDLKPLEKIGRVIQSINDYYTNGVKKCINLNIYMNNISECLKEDKAKKDFKVNYGGTEKDGTLQSEDSSELKIILTINSCNKKANLNMSSRKKEKKQDTVKEEPQKDQISTEKVDERVDLQKVKEEQQEPVNEESQKVFYENVALLKGIFNYIQPLTMWSESNKQMKGTDKTNEKKKKKKEKVYTPIEKLNFIINTTRHYFCHLHCLIYTEFIHLMHINVINLYDIFGVDLKEKKKQKKLQTSNDDNYYYYFDHFVDFANVIERPEQVDRDEINKQIKELIIKGHSEGKVEDPDSKTIILFGCLLHYLVGTRDSNKWNNITIYFAGYYITKLKDEGGNEVSSSDQVNQELGNSKENKKNLKIDIQRKNEDNFMDAAEKLIDHWDKMIKRPNDDKDKRERNDNINDDRKTNMESDKTVVRGGNVDVSSQSDSDTLKQKSDISADIGESPASGVGNGRAASENVKQENEDDEHFDTEQ